MVPSLCKDLQGGNVARRVPGQRVTDGLVRELGERLGATKG